MFMVSESVHGENCFEEEEDGENDGKADSEGAFLYVNDHQNAFACLHTSLFV